MCGPKDRQQKYERTKDFMRFTVVIVIAACPRSRLSALNAENTRNQKLNIYSGFFIV